ncbi:DASH family cryptochrome [Pseudoalteromonas sp. T1lg65]|uniref:DASH family cryptochrome n=1 Tax=Pseudoalteromonas sp. T1lg65 TaxID=2077101 RepID=UPI003F7A4455
MPNIGLYLFNNDQRLTDNPALAELCGNVDFLICAYFAPASKLSQNKAQIDKSPAALTYLNGSISGLQQNLKVQQQTLFLFCENTIKAVVAFCLRHHVTHIGSSYHCGYYEKQLSQQLKLALPNVEFIQQHGMTLFTEDALPFTLPSLPASFTSFRKQVEHLTLSDVIAKCKLPTIPNSVLDDDTIKQVKLNPIDTVGELAAHQYIKQYFSTVAASQYKLTRNALSGSLFSTRFSPYLATGAISPKQIVQALREYERQQGANESTYWIWFELLWREYFHWYAHKYGHKLFLKGGIKNKPLLTSFYPERFRKWCVGETPFRLVNAIMRELNETGWISNRARQITASCLVNELQVDWRYGAAYFEQTLIDYDVAANWGNWQYIAGVGADPRGGRHFDIEKQQALYDPNNTYTDQWLGNKPNTAPLDSISMVDWPNE